MEPATPSRGSQRHKKGFSVSSLISFISGTADSPTSSIKVVRKAPSPGGSDASGSKSPLPYVKYPDPAQFTFSNISSGIDTSALESRLQSTTEDIRKPFSLTISQLAADQHDLVRQMYAADSQVKQTLQTTNQRIQKTEKEAALLANSQRLSVLAERSYDEVEKILRLFREIDAMLPAVERLDNQSEHFPKLYKSVYRDASQALSPVLKTSKVKPAPSRAITSLRSIQESSPAASSAASVKTLRSVSAPLVEVDQGQAPRLRLAPRKSKSNLRVPQIRTLPPLPSTKVDTTLPSVERDNFSTRSSMASHRSVFSSISQFFGGQSSRRTVNEANFGPGNHINAEEHLRKISGGSLLGQTRKVSSASQSRS